jgi:hypothetical protein
LRFRARSLTQGYEIAIASAGCKSEYAKKFLQRRVDADVFTDAFLNSTAYQARSGGVARINSTARLLARIAWSLALARSLHGIHTHTPLARAQMCEKDKTVSLTAVVKYFGLDDARQCAILFDDLKYNGGYATSIGMGFQWIDNGSLQYKVGEPGIRSSDFFAAQATWARTCPTAAATPL